MKYSRFAAAMFATVLLAEEPEGSFVLPDALKSTPSEIPADQNNLIRFFAAFPRSTREIVLPLTKADERMDAGKDAGNPELLRKLLERHRQAKELLKPPIAFTPDTGPAETVALFGLFQEAGLLARQAMFEKDYPRAGGLIEDMLEWSRMLRNARPNLMQAVISRSGWQKAFNTLLLDWARHPDQAKRLAEIEQLHSKNRIDREELIETLKSEALWCARLGGLRKMLKDQEYADSATMFLKPPFNKLSAKDLLKLPYDAEADFRREMDEALGTLECLKNGTPMVRWPGFEIPVTGHTLEDYAKRPNGLGDIYREQMGSDTRNGVWSSALTRSPLLDACLHWLKLERDGKPVDETGFTSFLDPVNGKPLTIDVKLRTIRSRGLNQKVDPPDEILGPMPSAGFFTCGDDFMIVVPRWRPGVTGDGSKAEDK
jgi:hypothetical protein